jgi:hypothetical protein
MFHPGCYAMSLLRGRYSGSSETQFEFDIRQISRKGLVAYVESVLANELPDSFWTGTLPQLMTTSSIKSPYFLCYQAAQVKLGDRGFYLATSQPPTCCSIVRTFTTCTRRST